MTQAQEVLRDLLLDGDLTRAQVLEVLDEVLPWTLSDTILDLVERHGDQLREPHPDTQAFWDRAARRSQEASAWLSTRPPEGIHINPPEIDLDDLRLQLEADLAYQRSMLDTE